MGFFKTASLLRLTTVNRGVHVYCPGHFATFSKPLGNLLMGTPNNRATRLFSAFNPPPPPSSKGQPVFPDIDLIQEGKSTHARNNDRNAVFVVNGSSRGIGLQMVKTLLTRTSGSIVACCRDPNNAEELQGFMDSNKPISQRIFCLELDMEDQASIEKAGNVIRDKYNNRVDCLLNVAGILGDGSTTPGPERTINKIDRDWMEKTMQVNFVGPVMFTKELVPMLKTSTRARKGKTESSSFLRPISVAANLSARVGSISDNELGGWYSYRCSKSALNQVTRTMAHELKRQGIWTIALHPGTTDTDLSKPFQRNVAEGRLFPVDFTVNRLLNVVDGMTEANSGGLYDWAGKALSF